LLTRRSPERVAVSTGPAPTRPPAAPELLEDEPSMMTPEARRGCVLLEVWMHRRGSDGVQRTGWTPVGRRGKAPDTEVMSETRREPGARLRVKEGLGRLGLSPAALTAVIAEGAEGGGNRPARRLQPIRAREAAPRAGRDIDLVLDKVDREIMWLREQVGPTRDRHARVDVS
jgi:hypothetical protein